MAKRHAILEAAATEEEDGDIGEDEKKLNNGKKGDNSDLMRETGLNS
jgi:hypothetical protein